MLTYKDLVNDMKSGCKPREEWRIGIEHEQFVFNLETGLPLAYDGKPGIKQILEVFIRDYKWRGQEKNGYLVELKRDGALITLEPGGQIELAGAPHQSLANVKKEADKFYKELQAISKELGFGILAKGYHPEWNRDQIHLMPKERYKIMAPYMTQNSRHGVDMMLLTCGAQINLDFGTEEDMVKKFRVALGLQPVITALLANSNKVDGKDTSYVSYRSFIWTETDPVRCGVPEFVFDEDMSFSRYVDYALDVPMYFVIRNGKYIDVAGQSFRDFMEGKLKGHNGIYPEISDWHNHLTTLFPEVRLKKYLEFRGPDSASPSLVNAMSAFWTGILYNEEALDKAWKLISKLRAKDHVRIRNDVPKLGLDTAVTDKMDLRALAHKSIEIARKGVKAFEPKAADDLTAFRIKL